jgi:hypothetical protein
MQHVALNLPLLIFYPSIFFDPELFTLGALN